MPTTRSVTERGPVLLRPKAGFKADPSLFTVYQVAEVLGKTAAQVKNELTGPELWEWAIYLNSPFSARGRSSLENGWLVHAIRMILSDKNNPPKFKHSMFPIGEICENFVERLNGENNDEQTNKLRQRMAKASHMTQVIAQNYERAMREYRAGKRKNIFGLFYGERIKKL